MRWLNLVSGLLVVVVTVSVQNEPLFDVISQDDIDTILESQPGVRYARPASISRSSFDKRQPKDRFKAIQNWAPIFSYAGASATGLQAVPALSQLIRNPHHHGHENITAVNKYNTQYGIEVSFNSQSLLLTLDTGSADTWAVATGYNCTTWRHQCSFGPAYTGGFNGPPLKDEHLYVVYGDGEIVQGPLGPVDVLLAGVRVANQTVALANSTMWLGNNITSGVLGLAYPSITNAYGGLFGDHVPLSERPYVPVFTNMVDRGLVDDFFSIALGRNGADGTISFGGVPEHLRDVDYENVAMTDIIIASIGTSVDTTTDYSFYSIIPDGWLFGSETDERKAPYIVDSGTSFLFLPSELANAINGAFDPPAEFSIFGGYFTTCEAIPPRVAIGIGGELFWLSSEDLILRDVQDPLTGLCATTVGNGGMGPYVLGDVFLRNVLAVFDVGDAVMQFASRTEH